MLADNTQDGDLSLDNLPDQIEIQPINRSIFGLLGLNPGSLFQIAKGISTKDIRGSIPLSQLVRFVGLSLNYKAFLENVSADLLHVQHILHRPLICKRVLKSELPFIVTVQSVNYLMENNFQWHAEMALANYSTADRLIAVSRYVKEMMVNHGAEGGRIEVIPNGVDIDFFMPGPMETARRKLDLPMDKFIVLFTGNLVPRKGIDVLLKAFRRCVDKQPDCHIVILGDGSERGNLELLARELGIAEKVQFGGFRLLPEMPDWYRACDLFVMPSWAEGLSLSVLEAMAAAKPVITSYPTIGKHDAIIEGATGWLTNYGDVDELGKRLIECVERPNLTKQLGQNARQSAESHFSWQAIAKRTMNLYQEVLAEKG
jgi:glycosyltransferase involved in cell wall biosynthesis